GGQPRAGAVVPDRAPLRAPGRQLPVRALGLPGPAGRHRMAARARVQLGRRPGRDPGPALGAELSRRERRRAPARGRAHGPRELRQADGARGGRATPRERGATRAPDRRPPRIRPRADRGLLERTRVDPRRLSRLDGAAALPQRSRLVRTVAVLAAAALALPAAASASTRPVP